MPLPISLNAINNIHDDKALLAYVAVHDVPSRQMLVLRQLPMLLLPLPLVM